MEVFSSETPQSLNIRYSYSKKVRMESNTMKLETTKMSSKGQIVIPQDVRNEINAEEGTVFLVMASGDTLILKKVEMPSKEALLKRLEETARKGRVHLEKMGIKESDIAGIVQKARKDKNENRS